MDILIAATAHAHSARLYTRNAADLAGIEHLIEIVQL
jgi:predicted nucleic acid-binding protein